MASNSRNTFFINDVLFKPPSLDEQSNVREGIETAVDESTGEMRGDVALLARWPRSSATLREQMPSLALRLALSHSRHLASYVYMAVAYPGYTLFAMSYYANSLRPRWRKCPGRFGSSATDEEQTTPGSRPAVTRRVWEDCP
ncbi:hypothetical protein B0T10DRAFT_462886 [Thelonectria olida]|uniref:Uncharacterized protein n=1 Tax=Thelonectria olida TaxID=1576542 RepID=A0A9P8W1H7_9HYPO|nr:hypothetical protein B0T10DRAFT_462886 [Thelonectria olida]